MKTLSPDSPWRPDLQWNTPAGRVLDRVIDALPTDHPWTLIVFGSTPLQMGISARFLSADIDLIAQENIAPYLKAAGLLKGQAPLYVEPCPPSTFTAASDWQNRAFVLIRRGVTLVFPHPMDILVSKVKRLEKKDLDAFKLVLKETGHPTESELKIALQRAVDLYRPGFDEETAGDPLANTRILWRELYGRNIDVRSEIIARALSERKAVYGAARKFRRKTA